MSRDTAPAAPGRVHERAPAKVNLVLQVGPRRPDGLHELSSLFAALELDDDVVVEASPSGHDEVTCPGVEGPNLALAALGLFRARAGAGLGPVQVTIAKRIPVAAGLGGGSADAAAVLRGANAMAGWPLGTSALRRLGAELGSDVPSQVEPRHAIVSGAGEEVEPVQLPSMALVLVPQAEGLSTAAVYAAADRLRSTRSRVDPEALRALAARPLEHLAAQLHNDLEPASLSLRPQLARVTAALRAAGALAAQVTGSGPTVFGVFEDEAAARVAADAVQGALVTRLREP